MRLALPLLLAIMLSACANSSFCGGGSPEQSVARDQARKQALRNAIGGPSWLYAPYMTQAPGYDVDPGIPETDEN